MRRIKLKINFMENSTAVFSSEDLLINRYLDEITKLKNDKADSSETKENKSLVLKFEIVKMLIEGEYEFSHPMIANAVFDELKIRIAEINKTNESEYLKNH
jgi:hypothetical protein